MKVAIVGLAAMTLACTGAVAQSKVYHIPSMDLRGSSPDASLQANAVSDDGQWVVGSGYIAGSGVVHAFVWEFSLPLQTPTAIETTYNLESVARGVNDDGSIVCGTTNNNFGDPFWWNGTVNVLSTSGSSELALCVSGDGDYIGGLMNVQCGAMTTADRPIRWDVSGTPSSSCMCGGTPCVAHIHGINQDGTIAVGVSGSGQPVVMDASGITTLPTPMSASGGKAWAISDDGSVIAGTVSMPGPTQDLVIWVESSGSYLSPTVIYTSSNGFVNVDVSGDGTTVVAGEDLTSNIYQALIWRDNFNSNAVPLADYLYHHCYDMSDLGAGTPPAMYSAAGTNEDGSVATGWYSNDYSYYTTLPMDDCLKKCQDIDFNNDTLYPDSQDITDFLYVFGGGTCGSCDSVDFNGDGLFPDNDDYTDFLRVYGGGCCCP
jgi:uncharacterized membrane protein